LGEAHAPVSTPSSSASGTRPVHRLAGKPAGGLTYTGLPPAALDALLEAMVAARLEARMSVRKFVALDGPALTGFAARFHFARAEVRLGQEGVRLIWAAHRMEAIGRMLERTRTRATVQ
jgi:hypothetical protein